MKATRSICELGSGTVTLLDYAAGQIYVSRDEGGVSTYRLCEYETPGTDGQDDEDQVSRRSKADSGPDSLREFPLIVNGNTLGLLSIIRPKHELKLIAEQVEAIKIVAGLAATLIHQKDSPELRSWLNVFARVSAASHGSSSKENIAALLEEITEAALEISKADFVVLYEYFKGGNDVHLPPTISGTPREEEVLTGRGVVAEHLQSILFRLVERPKPLYATAGARDWVRVGLMSEDAAKSERSFFAREGVRSSAGFSLMVEDEPVGMLFLNYRNPHSFGEDFCSRFEQFVDQAALAIGNKRFFLRSRRYSQNLEAVDRIGKRLGSAVTLDIEKIGELLDEETRKEIPTRNFFLCIYDQESQRFSLPYLRDEHDTQETLEPRLKDGLAALVCRLQETLLLTREQQAEIFARGEAELIGKPSAVWLGAPLILRDQVKGAIVVQDFRNKAAFNEGHRQLLSAIAAQAAIAIDNHRLLYRTRLQLEELAALLSLAQDSVKGKLVNTERISEILDKICSFAGGDGSLLLLVDRGASDSLNVAATSSALRRYLRRTFVPGEGVSGKVLRDGQALIENNYPSWPGRVRLFDPPPSRVCAVPLILRGKRIGVLTLSSDSPDDKFCDREVEILQRFAGPVAIAIQNSWDLSFRKALIDAGPYAIVAVDTRGHITEFNAEATKLFQYTFDELRNESVAKLYRGGIVEARRIQAMLKKSSVIRDEETFGTNRAGHKIPVSLSAALLENDEGKAMGSVGILEDLRLRSLRTRTQLLVEALREISDTEELGPIAERVVDSAVTLLYADAGCLLLHDDNEFRVAESFEVDESAPLRLASSPAQMALKDLASAERPAISSPIQDEMGEVLRLRDSSRSSVLIRVQTEQRLLAFLLVESRQEDHFLGDQNLLMVLASQAAVAINRVQLLQYREKTARGLLVAANAIAVGQIATTFIHEARNSLNSMNLVAQGLAEDIEREPNLGKKKDFIDRLTLVQDEVARFGALSQRLQRFTHQGLEPVKQEAYLNPIVERTLLLLESTLRSKRMKSDLRLDPSLNLPSGKGRGNPIRVDEHQVQQVLMNLILNAIGASNKRQPIVIETHNHPDRVEVKIQDYGQGIPADVRKSLFEPFFTTKKDGVGLGLYLSRILIADNHGGSIEIESSAPGKGTTFAVRLPKSSQ